MVEHEHGNGELWLGNPFGGGGRTAAGDYRVTAANDHIRELAGRIAFELGTTSEGRAVGLSVEVWLDGGVGLRVRAGHELRLFAEVREDGTWVMWERVDPGPHGGRPQTSRGSLGQLDQVGPRDVRALMTRWLAWRTHG